MNFAIYVPPHDHLWPHRCSCHTWQKITCYRILLWSYTLVIIYSLWQHTCCLLWYSHHLQVHAHWSLLISFTLYSVYTVHCILYTLQCILTGRLRQQVWAGKRWASRPDSPRLWLHTSHRRSLALLSWIGGCSRPQEIFSWAIFFLLRSLQKLTSARQQPAQGRQQLGSQGRWENREPVQQKSSKFEKEKEL